MPASKAHDLIVALLTRKLIGSGYQIAAIESSLDWLFGDGFRLPPAIVLHRPDVLGVRDHEPFLAIGDAKTVHDLATQRTSEQLRDFAGVTVGREKTPCLVMIGVPQSGAEKLRRLIARLGISANRISILTVPDALLDEGAI